MTQVEGTHCFGHWCGILTDVKRRVWWAAAPLVFLLMVSACSGSDQSAPQSASQYQSLGSAASSSTAGVASRPVVAGSSKTPPSSRSVPARFTPSMVRAYGVTKQNKGGQSNVRFVANSTSARDIEQMSKECVKHFARQTKAAYCYAYGTQADYEITTPDWTPEFDQSIYGGSRPCWIAQAGQSLNDADRHDGPSVVAAADAVSYASSNCPGGVRF